MENQPWSIEQQNFACELFKHKSKTESVLKRLFGDGTGIDCEDVFQDALIKAVNNLHQFRSDAKILTWFTRIAINELLDKIRKNEVRSHIFGKILNPSIENDEGDCESCLDFCPDPAPNPEDVMITRNLLAETKTRLSEEEWWLFKQRYYLGKRNAQIVEETGISENTLKVRIFRALSKLELCGILPPNRILGPKKSYKKRKPKTLGAVAGR